MDAEAVVRDLCEAFSRTDVDELLTYFAPDAIYVKVPVGRFEGHDQIRGTLEEFFGPEVSVRFEILNLASDGARVAGIGPQIAVALFMRRERRRAATQVQNEVAL